MSLVNDIHVMVDVGKTPTWVGTNSALTLTISGGGSDLFVGSWTGANQLGGGFPTVPIDRTGPARVPVDTQNRRDLAEGGPFVKTDLWSPTNYLIFQDEDPYQPTVDTTVLDASSIRLATRGPDLLRPRHIVVWGLTNARLANYPMAPATVPTPVPLGIATGLTSVALSTDFREGMTSFLVPRMAPWRRANPALPERRVDTVVLTIGLGDDHNAPTPGPVTFQIRSADGRLLCSQALEGADEIRPSEWKTWVFAVATPFTWSEIVPVPPPPQPCRLQVDNDNKLQVARVYAFGMDTTSTPMAALPLVHFDYSSAYYDNNGFWIGRDEFLLPTANHDVSEAA
jgi:hypothetical protein